MKSALTVILFILFTIGVCVDGYEVSVTEGDSVTLKSGFTEIQTEDEIEWRFSVDRIATISRGDSGISPWVKPDGSFRDRLQLDNQTGDLKISNIRTTDSGEYKVKISRLQNPPPEMIFTVKVVSAAAVKSVPLLEGDSVTLLTDLTEVQTNDVIQWRFGQQKSLLAEINRKAGTVNTDGADVRFKDRLKLDQTGSLTIRDIGINQSGLYEVEISLSISRYTRHYTQSFRVTVSDSVESVSVLEGDNVTLRTGLTGTQTDDQIVWKFGDEVIADLNGLVNKTWSYFGLNNQTGDLNISNVQSDQSGLYKVEIITRRMILHRKYQITIVDAVKSVSVKEGDSVTLQINVTEIQNDDLIHWMFGDTVLAEIHKTAQRFYISDVPDKSFRNRLQLNHQTGSLIINNTRTTDSRDYKVRIISRRHIINRRITVIVALPGPGLSPAAVAGIGVGLLLAAAAGGGVFYYRYKKYKK